MKKIYVLSLLLILLSCNVLSQSGWQKTYGGADEEYATCIINTFDGGVAVSGYTYSYGFGNSDICLLKLNPDGSTQWVKTFGGQNTDIAYALIQSSDSGYVIVGSTMSYGQGSYEDMYIVKLNSFGEFLWAKTIGRSGMDIGYTVKQTADGGLIVVGYSRINFPLEYGLMIVKISDDAMVEWIKMARKVNGGFLSPSVIQTVDGGYGIVGTIDSVIGGSDICLMKLNSSGMLQHSWIIGGSNDEQAYSLCQTADNAYAISGFSNSFGAGYPDLYIVKVGFNGKLHWARTIGGNNDDYAISMINSIDGCLTIGGESFSYGFGSIDMYIVKIDLDGRFIWNKTIGGSGLDFMRSIAGDRDGGYVAVGRTYSFGAGESDMYIVKTDSGGNVCNSITPIPHIDSGGIILKVPVNIYSITPTVSSVNVNISSFGEISNRCITELSPNASLIPKLFSLHQNYPNPFNPITKIKFDIPNQSSTKIIIYDMLGIEVTTLVNEQLKPGSYEVDWDGSGYASGVYFYQLVVGDNTNNGVGYIETKRMVLVK